MTTFKSALEKGPVKDLARALVSDPLKAPHIDHAPPGTSRRIVLSSTLGVLETHSTAFEIQNPTVVVIFSIRWASEF